MIQTLLSISCVDCVGEAVGEVVVGEVVVGRVVGAAVGVDVGFSVVGTHAHVQLWQGVPCSETTCVA